MRYHDSANTMATRHLTAKGKKNGEVNKTSPSDSTVVVEGLDVRDHQTNDTDDTNDAREGSNFKFHWKAPPGKNMNV